MQQQQQQQQQQQPLLPPQHALYLYLLQFIKAMDLIDEENGLPPKHYSLVLGHLHHLLHLTHPTGAG